MTDTLNEEFLSTSEFAPVASTSSVDLVQCEYCDKTFKNVIGYKRWMQNHVRTQHPDQYSGPQTKQKKSPGRPKKAASTTTVVKSRTVSRRPLGESIARIVLQVGKVINSVIDPPTGAAIMFEAGALGEAIDKAIAGSMIDKPLQKGAAVADKFEPLIPLITLPALTFMLSRNPEAGSMLEGELREALEDVLVQSLPLLRKRAQRSKATVDALSELRIVDPALADSQDPVGDILRGFFTVPATPVPDMPEPDA